MQQAPQNAFSQVGGAQASYQEDSPQENLPQKGAQAESASDSASDSAAESAEDVIAELNAMAYKEASALDYLPRPIGSLRKNRHPALTLFIGMLIIFLIFFFVAARMVFGKGWIVNMIEGNDNFRFEDAEYAKRLSMAGVKVTAKCFLNSNHGFIVHCTEEWEEGQDLVIAMLRQASL